MVSKILLLLVCSTFVAPFCLYCSGLYIIQKQLVCEIVGHRGAGSSCVEGESSLPENSLAAFTRAVRLGLKLVELDVWLTNDNEVVVIHGGGTNRQGFLKNTAISQVPSASLGESQANLLKQQGVIFPQAKGDAPTTDNPTAFSDPCSGAQSQENVNACTFAVTTPGIPEPTRSGSNEGITRVAQPDGVPDRIELLNYHALKNASLLPLLRRPWKEYVRSQIPEFKKKEEHKETARQAIVSPRHNLGHVAKNSGAVHVKGKGSEASEEATKDLRALVNIPSWRLSSDTVENQRIRQPSKKPVSLRDNESLCKDLEFSSDDKCFEDEAPWLISAVETLIQEPLTVKQRYLLTPKAQKAAAADAYEKDSVPFTVEHSPEVLPLLETVLKQFQGQLSFIVELKGTRPELGRRVLEIAERYPGTVDQISSFSWQAKDHVQLHTRTENAEGVQDSVADIALDLSTIPGDVADKWLSPASAPPSSLHLFPNGDVPADLLAPIRNNTANIPIALLFGNRYRLPGVKDILAYLTKYNSRWAHVPWHFLFEDPEDHANALKLQKKVLALPGARRFLEKLPTVAEVARLGLPVNARAQSELNTEVSFEPAVPAREVVQQELASLLYLTQKLHSLGYKVMAYGSNGQETEDMLSLYMKIGLDRLCPNNIAAASQALEKHRRDRSKKFHFNPILHPKGSVNEAAVVSSTYNERPVSDHSREISLTPAATGSPPDFLSAS